MLARVRISPVYYDQLASCKSALRLRDDIESDGAGRLVKTLLDTRIDIRMRPLGSRVQDTAKPTATISNYTCLHSRHYGLAASAR